MAAIRTIGLERSFGKLQAVRGIDLEVSPGELYGFLGPNGAGKTTTVRMLVTLLRPTGGNAEVAGFDVADHPAEVRRRIGVALQEAALDLLMTGKELMELQATLHGIDPRRVRSRAADLIERVGLADAQDRRVGTYSGGMRRRLDLAMALVHEPEVLFLDEPTTGLDPVSRLTLWEEIGRLKDQGTTVFLTTQYLEEADRLADRVGIISAGEIVAEGTPATLKAEVGVPRLEIALADEGDARLAGQAIADLGEIVPCHADHDLAIKLPSGADQIASVVRRLDDEGFHVASLELVEPTLDDVFVEKTGRYLEGSASAEDAAVAPVAAA
jgi:ABC-2 type transport system ATP-binding protein